LEAENKGLADFIICVDSNMTTTYWPSYCKYFVLQVILGIKIRNFKSRIFLRVTLHNAFG
jgi:hypothetical protein